MVQDLIFKVALLQMVASTSQEHNRVNGEKLCRQAAQAGADIALFPEMMNIGYAPFYKHFESIEDWHKQAIAQDDPFIKHFQLLAKELKMAIVLTYLEKWQPYPRNSLVVIDRHGEIVLSYAKVHLCSFDQPELTMTGGDQFKVVALDTRSGPVKIGTMICFDREFPESARVLMLQGAEIILTPNACPLDDQTHGLGDIRIQQFRTRAFENMVGVAMTNYAAPVDDGHSCAFDVDGSTLVMADASEGVFLAPFNLSKIRYWQHHEVWGKKFRRPDCYKLL